MVFVHLAEGFEEVEALTVVDVLRRGQVEVRTVSVTGEKVVNGSHGIPVCADILFEEADYEDCQMIVLPGGMPGAANLRDHRGLCDRIRAFRESGKGIAAICAAPMVLGSCGILEGGRATIYPGMEDELTGAEATGEDVTVWENIITGKGPGLAMAFALKVLETIRGRQVRDQVAEGLLF